MTKPNYTDITVVLDRSGSMESIRSATIDGFNEFLRAQKATPGEATFTLVQFDDQYEVVYNAVDLGAVPELNHNTFVPRGWTALRDAVCQRILETGSRLSRLPESERPSKVVFLIITDGQENRSTRFTGDDVRAMIRMQEEVYSWEFVFVGASEDAIKQGEALGVTPGKSAKFSATNDGARAVFTEAARQLSSYRTADPGTKIDEFFTADQRKRIDQQ